MKYSPRSKSLPILFHLFILFAGCSPSVYQELRSAEIGDPAPLRKFIPKFTRALYIASIDVTGHHLSGLLLIKTMPDSSVRMVFSNEMGIKFFDFEFSGDGDFQVHSIIKQMDKKPVIRTLQKDFEMVLMKDLKDGLDPVVTETDSMKYYGFQQAKGVNYFITRNNDAELVRLVRASNRKSVAEIFLTGFTPGIPAEIHVSHTNFEFDIQLKLIPDDPTE